MGNKDFQLKLALNVENIYDEVKFKGVITWFTDNQRHSRKITIFQVCFFNTSGLLGQVTLYDEFPA